MLKRSLIFDNDFWKTLEYLDNLTQSAEVGEILQMLSISEKYLFDVISFLEEFDYKIRIKKRKNKRFLIPGSHSLSVKPEFSSIHWIALQIYFPLLIEQSKAFYPHEVIDKLLEIREKDPNLDFLCMLNGDKHGEISSERMRSGKNAVKIFIEEGLEKRKGLSISLTSGRNIEVYPRELIYLDGDLSIVGEDISEQGLVYLSLKQIKEVSTYNISNNRGIISSQTVHDFIRAIRMERGREERIVLKIYADKNVNLSPNYHFLNNPCIVNGHEGELIWAASVEVSHPLFHWLYSIKDDMEILNPESLKKEFSRYCTQKRNIA